MSTTFSNKFGDDLVTDEQMHTRFSELENLGYKIEGIHFHSGSGVGGSKDFKKGILLARKCIEIGRKYGHPMNIMDIGGGFAAAEINEETLDALRITKNDPLNYKVLAEPGRHIAT